MAYFCRGVAAILNCWLLAWLLHGIGQAELLWGGSDNYLDTQGVYTQCHCSSIERESLTSPFPMPACYLPNSWNPDVQLHH
eukprot:3286666-Amphidinium_carterae.1